MVKLRHLFSTQPNECYYVCTHILSTITTMARYTIQYKRKLKYSYRWKVVVFVSYNYLLHGVGNLKICLTFPRKCKFTNSHLVLLSEMRLFLQFLHSVFYYLSLWAVKSKGHNFLFVLTQFTSCTNVRPFLGNFRHCVLCFLGKFVTLVSLVHIFCKDQETWAL